MHVFSFVPYRYALLTPHWDVVCHVANPLTPRAKFTGTLTEGLNDTRHTMAS